MVGTVKNKEAHVIENPITISKDTSIGELKEM